MARTVLITGGAGFIGSHLAEALLELGLQPHLLGDELIDTMLHEIRAHRDQIDPATLVQNIRWVPMPPRETVNA